MASDRDQTTSFGHRNHVTPSEIPWDFNWDLVTDDVGLGLILGPTRAGKSVLTEQAIAQSAKGESDDK